MILDPGEFIVTWLRDAEVQAVVLRSEANVVRVRVLTSQFPDGEEKIYGKPTEQADEIIVIDRESSVTIMNTDEIEGLRERTGKSIEEFRAWWGAPRR